MRPFKLDTLVELIDRYSNVYPHSPSGARGWVRARREMPKIDPEVYIEWDKDHWRYNGEPDGWTYEHHFRLVDESELAIKPEEPSITKMISDARAQIESERCASCGGLHDHQDAYIEGLMRAQDAALSGDAYLMITLRPTTVGGTTIYQPDIFAHALTPLAQQVTNAQVLHLAARLYEQDLLDRVELIERDDDQYE